MRGLKIVSIIALGLSAVVVSAIVPEPAQASLTVVPRKDTSDDVGMFAIHNPTRVAITYQVKWGNKGEWKSFTVAPGKLRRHWYNLDQNHRAPSPYVRFDNTGGDGRITRSTYHVKFRTIVGGSDGQGTPKDYVFAYAADGRRLDLTER